MEIIISGTSDAVAPATDIFINIHFSPMLKYRKVKSFIHFLFLYFLFTRPCWLVKHIFGNLVLAGLYCCKPERFQIKYRETAKRCSGL